MSVKTPLDHWILLLPPTWSKHLTNAESNLVDHNLTSDPIVSSSSNHPPARPWFKNYATKVQVTQDAQCITVYGMERYYLSLAEGDACIILRHPMNETKPCRVGPMVKFGGVRTQTRPKGLPQSSIFSLLQLMSKFR